MNAEVANRGWWQILLGVRTHERGLLALSFLYFFCLLTGYYVLRPVRDAMGASADVGAVFPIALIDWFAARGIDLGEFTLQVLFSSVFLCMLLLQPIYGALVSRFPRRVFLPFIYVAFIACLIGFYAAFDWELSGRGAAFFVFAAVFNLFAVAVFWSFMADIYADSEARRLYGTIAAGGTLGGLVGPQITIQLVGPLGVANMLLISAAFLAVCLICILALIPAAIRRERERGTSDRDAPIGGSAMAAFAGIWRDPLLRSLATLMFFGVGVGTLLYNEQREVVRASGIDAAAATAFYSRIDSYINWTVLAIQLLLTRPLLTRFGVAPMLLLPGAAILFGFAVLTASPLPALIAIVQVATRACEFSLGKPARETIYTRVDRESRYKAKAAIDTVVYRGGDLFFVWIHKPLMLFGSNVVFAFGTLAAVGMLASAWRVVKAQRGLVITDSATGCRAETARCG